MPNPSTSSATTAPVTASLPSPSAQVADAMAWRSVVRSHKLGLEHAAVDIDTDRVLYHMELELVTPLPTGSGLPGQWLCLTWPYGGLWKIERVTDNNTKVQCLSWRKTELHQEDMEELVKSTDALAKKVEAGDTFTGSNRTHLPTNVGQLKYGEVALIDETPDLYPTLFEWKMMLGEWESDATHWFIRDIEPPAQDQEASSKRQLIAKLFVGFDPLEASIEVNAVTAIDTVAQTYSADVTWQVMFPAITSLREDSVLREFLDLLAIDANEFEFTNIAEMSDQRELSTSLVSAGQAQFRDLTLEKDQLIHENVYHLTFRRRISASFTTEMALHFFPFDQQKLIFEFTTSSGMSDSSVIMVPTPVEPGSFSIENYQLGNVFDVLYHQKVFVSEVQESGPKKYICFEMVLQRRSGYYLTNVALIAAIITYLCFVTYATEDSGETMDMSSRLQIVSALVLTAVTFKNQVAELIPRVSYFTVLDKYVFVCFCVTTLVMIENALFPVFKNHVGVDSDKGLLGISIGVFTLINIGWVIYLRLWLRRRSQAANTLMQVHEYIREISKAIPMDYRSHVLHRFLDCNKLEDWCRPKFIVTSTGDLHIQAPDEGPQDNAVKIAKIIANSEKQKETARNAVTKFKQIYNEMRPGLHRRMSTPVPTIRSPGGHRLNQSRDDTAINVEAYHSVETINLQRNRVGSDAINVDPYHRPRRASNPTRKHPYRTSF